MSKIDLSKYKIDESDGVFTFKNENTTLNEMSVYVVKVPLLP